MYTTYALRAENNFWELGISYHGLGRTQGIRLQKK